MCLDDQVLSTYIDGELVEPWKTQVEEHLLHCTRCKSRYSQLTDLEQDIKSARLREEEFSQQRERVWQYLEKNCVTAVKEKIFEKRFTFKAPVLFAAAAAAVIIFAAGIFFTARLSDTEVPEIPVIASAENSAESEGSSLINVVATDSAPAARTLEDLTIEEILQLLDDRGFDVDLRLKSVERLTSATTDFAELENMPLPEISTDTAAEEEIPVLELKTETTDSEEPAEEEVPVVEEPAETL